MIDAIIERVATDITGRFANAGNNARHLLEIVESAGDGNYLEIGVLHGGSLCSVALLKKALGHQGICVGVDPFDGWYYDTTGKISDPSGVPVVLENVKANLAQFGLDNVELIQAKSPDFETDKKFNVAYIDGDHREKAVWLDWIKVKAITSQFVAFHDYRRISGVTTVCLRAAKNPHWEIYYDTEPTFILRKTS